MRSFILIHATVWPQCTNVKDRETGHTDRQRSDSTRRTVLQTVAPKTTRVNARHSTVMGRRVEGGRSSHVLWNLILTVDAEVTRCGSLFQMWTAVATDARSPTFQRRMRQIFSGDATADRRLRTASEFAARKSSSTRKNDAGACSRSNCARKVVQLEVGPLRDFQPATEWHVHISTTKAALFITDWNLCTR